MALLAGSGGRPARATSLAGRWSSLGRGGAVLLVVGLFFTNLAAASLWGWRTFASSEGFADVATDMLHDPDVRQIVSTQIVNSLAEQSKVSQLASSMRPVLEQVVSAVVATNAFQGVFHAGVEELHAAVVTGHRTRLLVPVDDAGQLVKDGLQTINPSVADSIPDGALAVAVGISQSTPVDSVMRIADICGWVALPFLLVAIACFAAIVLRAPDRRRAVEAVGWGLIVLGLLQFAVLYMGGGIASRMGGNELEGHALRALFWSITNLLSIQATLLITAGAVLAVAGAYSGTGQLQLRAKAAYQSLGRRLAEPHWKALASLALIALAVVAMVWPAATAAVVVRVLAFTAFVVGAVGLLDLIGSRHWTNPTYRSVPTRRLALASVGGIVALSAVMFFGGLAFLRAVRAPHARHEKLAATCNDHVELCDRPLDRVVFAGTHNSMSAAAEPHWYFARQNGGILAQLSRGVRAFLVDLHYGWQLQGVVRTDLEGEGELATSEADVPPDAVKMAKGLLAMAGAAPPPSERKLYLCHNYCELGASRAADSFRAIRDFLRENPNEVILLDIEDHVSGADAVKELKKSGLADLAYTWTPGTPMPTLRQMIKTKKNVLIMAEYRGGAAPWYLDAYKSVLQETPYKFGGIADFSCDEHRGLDTNPLLLINHWLDNGPPSSADAQAINAASVLEGRARRCEQQRNHVPNILAVDYYNKGDLFQVVDKLNDVAGADVNQPASS